MKAAVFEHANLLTVREVQHPRAEPGQVVMKIAFCGICGSDLHRYAHGLMAPGVIMGHEFSGVIAEVGEGVTEWAVGDRAIRGFRDFKLPPRYSARDKGFSVDPDMPGGYAEYVAVPATAILRIPNGLSVMVAALTEPLTVAVHAVRLSNLKIGDAVVVLGAGPIGLLTMQCIRECAPRKLIVCEPVPARRELALQLGADVVLDPREVDVVAEVVRLTNDVGPDAVFECAGAKPTLQQSLEMARQRGQVTLVALSMEPCEVSPLEWVGREVQLQCAYGANARDWELALSMLVSGRVQGEQLISKIVPLGEIQNAFQGLLRPTDELQVLVQP